MIVTNLRPLPYPEGYPNHRREAVDRMMGQREGAPDDGAEAMGRLFAPQRCYTPPTEREPLRETLSRSVMAGLAVVLFGGSILFFAWVFG